MLSYMNSVKVNGGILIVGGFNNVTNSASKKVFKYDPITE